MSMTKTAANHIVRQRDLPQSPAYGTMLRCEFCGEDYSAHRGDYFWADPNERMDCGACGEPLKLVSKRTTYQSVSA